MRQMTAGATIPKLAALEADVGRGSPFSSFLSLSPPNILHHYVEGPNGPLGGPSSPYTRDHQTDTLTKEN